MPRGRRLSRINQCYHIMLRGVGGQNIFSEAAERVRFCLLLQAASEKHDFKIHAFCLLDNHVHLILEPVGAPISSCIHAFSFRYAQYFNKRHRRRGYLYQGRYKSILIEDGQYLKRLIRYIHLNPVEGGLCKDPQGYKWSSHRAYLGAAEYVWLTTEHVLCRFGSNKAESLLKFAEFFQSNVNARVENMEITKALKESVFGSASFTQTLIFKEHEFKENSLRISLEEALAFVCNRFQITKDKLVSSDKSKHYVDARSVLSLIAKKAKDWSLEDMAHALGKNNGTISRLASRGSKDPLLTELIKELS